jgi:hypothetical protein
MVERPYGSVFRSAWTRPSEAAARDVLACGLEIATLTKGL